jgi:hypothetical protein
VAGVIAFLDLRPAEFQEGRVLMHPIAACGSKAVIKHGSMQKISYTTEIYGTFC